MFTFDQMHHSYPYENLVCSLNSTSVIEFYAPWCPHCQHFKNDYIDMAFEVLRRSTSTPVQFHAVSCDVYYDICDAYDIDGYPTMLGWKLGADVSKLGIDLMDEGPMNADKIGELLALDLANEEVSLSRNKFNTTEEQLAHEAEMNKLAQKAVEQKRSWHEQYPHNHNDKYHDAALSLAFAIKSQLFQTTRDRTIENKRRRALMDFLNLLDWATPQSWGLRTGIVTDLQWRIESNVLNDRSDLESIIEADMKHHRPGGSEQLWGFIDSHQQTSFASALFRGRSQKVLAKDDNRWTKTCTHSQPAKGFTCGLWNLFHISTIGSSKQESELYGFHRGYDVSSHHVAETIRNFVAYFFSCDVCRDNYLVSLLLNPAIISCRERDQLLSHVIPPSENVRHLRS